LPRLEYERKSGPTRYIIFRQSPKVFSVPVLGYDTQPYPLLCVEGPESR